MTQTLCISLILIATGALAVWIIAAPILHYFGLDRGADQQIEDPDEMVTLFRFRDKALVPVVNIELGRLDIPFYIHNEIGAATFGSYLTPLEEMRVQVARRDRQQAAAALERCFS